MKSVSNLGYQENQKNKTFDSYFALNQAIHNNDSKSILKYFDFNYISSYMESLRQQMVEAKKRERAESLKKMKKLYKDYRLTAAMLKGALTEAEKKK